MEQNAKFNRLQFKKNERNLMSYARRNSSCIFLFKELFFAYLLLHQ